MGTDLYYVSISKVGRWWWSLISMMTMLTIWKWGGVGSQLSEIITFDDWFLVAKLFFSEPVVFHMSCFFPWFWPFFLLLKELVVLRLVFSTKKKGQNHGKKQGMWRTTGSEKNHLATRNQSSKVMISESWWLPTPPHCQKVSIVIIEIKLHHHLLTFEMIT